MEVITRLFNHYPATNREVKHFVQEFDQKLIRDETTLEFLVKSSYKLSNEVLPNSLYLLEKNLAKLQAKVPVCQQMSERILSLEVPESSSEEDKKSNSHSPQLTEEFLQNISIQTEAINENFREAVAKLHSEYEQMAIQVQRENP